MKSVIKILSNLGRWFWGPPRWRLALGVGALAVLVWWSWQASPVEEGGTVFVVRRGPLEIRVLEGGSVEALEAQEIRSEVKGMQGTKILKIVDEGYLVTEEDVKTAKVLVELDASDLRQRMLTHEIQFQSTLALLIDAQQAYDIQLNQNKTDVKAAEQKARFARMDFEKFVGDQLAARIIEQLGLFEEPFTNILIGASFMEPMTLTNTASQAGSLAQMSQHLPNDTEPLLLTTNGGLPSFTPKIDLAPVAVSNTPATHAGATTNNPAIKPTQSNLAPAFDFSKYAKSELLGDGAAKQQLRKLEDDLLVSRTELGLARTKLDGSKRLHDKGFVTKTELENEQITVDKTDLKVKTAETALDLFIKYEFPKQAEEFLSKYEEALRALERTRKEALAKLAQAHAKLKSSEGRYKIELAQRQEYAEQLDKCVIRAQKPGLVVYGGNPDGMFFGGNEPIREGATVRERQRILTIPDMTQMAVKVKIHESHIKKIKRGLKTRIEVDAFAEEELTGEVFKVGVLPDSQNRWMNPDLKVYVTTISIDGAHDWVKPGMSAKVSIHVKTLTNVLYVPIQSVYPNQGKHFCQVLKGSSIEQRAVELGDFNDEFIAVQGGLKEGEKVLLRAPEGVRLDEEPTDEPIDSTKPKDPKPATSEPGSTGPSSPSPNTGPVTGGSGAAS